MTFEIFLQAFNLFCRFLFLKQGQPQTLLYSNNISLAENVRIGTTKFMALCSCRISADCDSLSKVSRTAVSDGAQLCDDNYYYLFLLNTCIFNYTIEQKAYLVICFLCFGEWMAVISNSLIRLFLSFFHFHCDCFNLDILTKNAKCN